MEDLERKYWANITINRALYAADVEGSVSDEELDVCNMRRLGTILDRTMAEELPGKRIPGVNTCTPNAHSLPHTRIESFPYFFASCDLHFLLIFVYFYVFH